MKRHEFNEVLFEEATEALAERFAECKSSRKGGQSAGQKTGLRKARSKGGGFDRMPKAQQKRLAREGGESPRRRRCENVEEDGVNNSETLDFTLCQRPDGSYYGTAGQCRKGTETTRDDAMAKIEKAAKSLSPETKKKLEGLSDENLGRVADAVTKRGLTVDEGRQVARGVERLSGEKAGGKKEGGANLQDPGEAKKYADFYEGKKDLTYEPPMNTSPKVVKETLARLKEEDPKAYASTMSALSGKGSPTKEQLEAAGWKSSSERGQAVLKSLMDNDFRDVMGNELSWRQGLQLDHKQAGSTGGTDNPKNWIWISTATNQAKGGLEAAAQKKGLKGQEADTYIRNGLVGKLQKNAKMSAEEVAAAKGAGAARAQAKAQQAQAMKDNLPLMTSQQRAQRINDAGGEELKAMLKGSVAEGKNPATGRNTSYRPVLSGGDGARVRKAYGTTPQMKSLMRLRWGEEMSDSDLRNVGGILRASTGSKKTAGDKLDELLGNFPPTTGLTAAQRIKIINAAESDSFAESEDLPFDFGACQRPDGSIYGTSGQCRKGTPINLSDIKGAAKGKAGKGNPRMVVNKKRLAQLSDGQLQRVLNERSLAPHQKQAIKEELGGRGVAPKTSKGAVTARRERIQKAAKEGGEPSRRITKKFLREASDSKLEEYRLRAPNQYQRERISAELARRKKAGEGSTKQIVKDAAAPGTKGREARAKLVEKMNKKVEAEKTGAGARAAQKTKQPIEKNTRALKKEAREEKEKWNKLKNQRLAALKKGDVNKANEIGKKMQAKKQKIEDLTKEAQRLTGNVSEGLKPGLSPLGKKGYDPEKTYKDPTNKQLGQGAMGAAYRTKGPPPGVVKKGEIGEFEAAAIAKLKGVDGAPTLHGQNITGRQKSADIVLGGHIKSANGFLAMSEAPGKPLMSVQGERKLSGAEKGKVMDEYIRLRKDMHLRGVAHNDMHAGNFFYDMKTKKGAIVDFGLSQVSPRAALQEALGLTNPRADFQADRMVGRLQGAGTVKSARLLRFEKNQARAEKRLRELGFDQDENPGIRTRLGGKRDPWKNMTDDQANEVLGILYDGV